jgi:hypothetical protein
MTTARPESFWDMEDSYKPMYQRYVELGRLEARKSKVAIVCIARNAMPYAINTLELIDELAGEFREPVFYCFENDSVDGTDKALDGFAATRAWATVEHDTLHRPDIRGFEPERTIALAEYRNRCRLWVENHAIDARYTVVLDLDPHGGFSVEGVLNSIGWLIEYEGQTCQGVTPGGMASYSLYVTIQEDGTQGVAHYDAFAARLCWWEDRKKQLDDGQCTGHIWFHAFLPPAGCEPVPFYSAFGGLAVYKTEAFLAPGVHYAGGDCEHVALHKSMRQAGYGMWLNPGCRYAAILPERP